MKRSRYTPLLEDHIGVFNHRHLLRLDWWLGVLVCILGAVGIVTLFSANRSIAVTPPLYVKQSVFFIGGIGVAVVVACMDYRFLASLGPMVYGVVVALLAGVHLVGLTVKGGQRWLDLGLFRIQPSEFSKLALVFVLAWYLSRIGPKVKRLPYFLLAFVLAGIPGFLILAQPNLGTAAALGPVVFAMLYVAGCKRWHLAAVLMTGLCLTPVAWNQLEGYQRNRLLAFLDPAQDPLGSGYHTLQSMITVGSGGLMGKGYYAGTQTFLKYLPEHHNDFIFSLVAEEWGFLGGVLLLALFGLLLARGLWIAHECEDSAGSLMALGVVVILSFHVIVNIAITLGMMPVTGIPLPFLSYGGSFYLVTMTGIGVLLSVKIRSSMFDR